MRNRHDRRGRDDTALWTSAFIGLLAAIMVAGVASMITGVAMERRFQAVYDRLTGITERMERAVTGIEQRLTELEDRREDGDATEPEADSANAAETGRAPEDGYDGGGTATSRNEQCRP